MPGTIVAKKKGDAVSSSTPGAEKQYQELLAPLPFHEKLKKIDGLGSPEEAALMAIEIVGTDLEHRIVVGAFLLQVQEKALYKPGTFSDWIMDNMGMQLRRAEYYMKVSRFVLQANIPGEKLARLNWSHCRVLASRIEPSDLTNWSDLASQATVPELDEFFKQNRSTDPQQFVEWVEDCAGSDWREMARTAALNLPNEDADEESIGTQLLVDIKDIFSDRDVDRISSTDLCETLAKMEDRPWPEWRYTKPITMSQLARLLAPYVVRPKSIRLTNETTSKGYLLADFSDAFARYPSVQSAPEPKGGSLHLNLHADQLETVQMALEVCKEKSNTDYDSVAIDYICADHLSGSGVPGETKPATLQDLFRGTLKKHGDDESAAVATIISEFQAAFPKWTIHAEGPVGWLVHGRGFNPGEAIKEVENRQEKQLQPGSPKNTNGTPFPDYKPSSKEPFMNHQMFVYFRQKLLDWRNKLLSESNGTIQRLQECGDLEADIVDRASIEAERSLELKTRDRARKLIAKIDDALKRIDNGTYGYCEETGEPISLSRLEVQPTATLAIEAQERHERMEKTRLSRIEQMTL